MSPTVAELDTKRFTWEELVAVQGLTAEKQAKLAKFAKKAEEHRNKKTSRNGDGDHEDPGTPTDRSSVSRGYEPTDEDKEILEDIFGSDVERAALARIAFKVSQLGLIPGRKWFLNGALLTMVIGAFEVLIGSIRARRHDLHPESLGRNVKKFSLAELREYGSLADAESDAIRRDVEDFLHASNLDGWIEWYDAETGLSCRGYAIDFETLDEAFQRRNVIVHNAGRVSKRYLVETAEPASDLKVGELLPVSDDYLRRALDELDAFGTLLLIGAFSKWEPDEDETARYWLLDHAYESMLAGRWRVVRKLASYGKRLRENNENTGRVPTSG